MLADTTTLPTEIWREIFALSTRSEGTQDLCEREHVPFYYNLPENRLTAFNATLAVKLSLVLVCQAWKSVAVEFLYEDIHIGHVVVGLIECLKKYGHYVRRLQLPSHTTIVPHDPQHDIRLDNILRMCPRLQVIVKSKTSVRYYLWSPLEDVMATEFWTRFARPSDGEKEPITMNSLERFEWSDEISSRVVSPTLAFLLNNLNIRPRHISLNQAAISGITIDSTWFSCISSLRISNCESDVLSKYTAADFPHLSHVVLTAKHISLLQTLGAQLLSVEIQGSAEERGAEYDIVTDILALCPKLQQLSFLPHCTIPKPSQYEGHFIHGNLRQVWIGSSFEILSRCQVILDMAVVEGDEDAGDSESIPVIFLETTLPSMFPFLTPGICQGLKEIILDGDWSWLQEEGRIKSNSVGDRMFAHSLVLGVQVMFADGQKLEMGDQGWFFRKG